MNIDGSSFVGPQRAVGGVDLEMRGPVEAGPPICGLGRGDGGSVRPIGERGGSEGRPGFRREEGFTDDVGNATLAASFTDEHARVRHPMPGRVARGIGTPTRLIGLPTGDALEIGRIERVTGHETGSTQRVGDRDVRLTAPSVGRVQHLLAGLAGGRGEPGDAFRIGFVDRPAAPGIRQRVPDRKDDQHLFGAFDGGRGGLRGFQLCREFRDLHLSRDQRGIGDRGDGMRKIHGRGFPGGAFHGDQRAIGDHGGIVVGLDFVPTGRGPIGLDLSQAGGHLAGVARRLARLERFAGEVAGGPAGVGLLDGDLGFVGVRHGDSPFWARGPIVGIGRVSGPVGPSG